MSEERANDERADEAAVVRVGVGAPVHVLIAEDNPVNRVIAEELLRSAGLVAESVGDGARAVQLACAGRFALVLMDVHMPELGGLDAARAIRAVLGPALPIIAMTADDTSADRAACRAAGMNDYLVKPIEPDALFAALRRWLAPSASGCAAG